MDVIYLSSKFKNGLSYSLLHERVVDENEYAWKWTLKWNEKFVYDSLNIHEAYPRVWPIMSSAWDEIISAIISSFMASFSLRHFRPPGKTSGLSCACKPRKALAFFCFICLSSVTFCLSSADKSVLAFVGSCYSFWNVFVVGISRMGVMWGR